MPQQSRNISVPLLVLLACLAAGARAAAPPALPSPPSMALEATLAAEFALQAGKLPEAARDYLAAARQAGDDTALSERATRIAVIANERALAEQALALWQAQSPHAPGVRATAAVLALRDGRSADAQPLLAGLLNDPDPDAWRQGLGALVGAAGNPSAVSAVVTALVDAGQVPARLEVWQELGRLVLRFNDPALARHMVAAAVLRFPDEPRVVLLHANQLYAGGDREAALVVLEPLAGRVSQDPALRNALAMLYDAMGQTAQAAQIMAAGEQDLQSWSLRAALLVKQGDQAALERFYTGLVGKAGRPEPAQRLLLGKLAQYLRHFDQAVRWFRSVPGGPERAEAQLRTVNALYEMGDAGAAFAAVQALQGDVTLDKEVRRDAHLLEAELRRMQGGAAAELQALNRGLAAFADEPVLLYSRGLYWERNDDIARAEADLRAVLVSEPDNVAALNALGYTLADRTTRYQEALELIDRARVAEPDNAAIIDSYGWVLFRLGRLDEALAQLRRAWSLQRDAEVGAHLAEVLLAAGDAAQARDIYRQARALDAGNRAVQRLHDRLGE